MKNTKKGLPPMARRLLRFWSTRDGGPGSGNWGHRGRPGKVGGSGKGGGAQYRGGRSDIRYHGSRGDWINGLTGERQHEAERWLDHMRNEIGTPDEDNNALMQRIMMGGGSDAKKLTDFMAEARGWDKYAGRMMTPENLEEADGFITSALINKYGGAMIGGSFLPDEKNIENWESGDREAWLDIKSKAMGGPVSGKEPPLSLQIAAGLKKAPDVFPKTIEAENEKLESVGIERGRLASLLRGMGIEPTVTNEDGFSTRMDLNKAETELLKKMRRFGLKSLNSVRWYLMAKDEHMFGKAFEKALEASMDGQGSETIGNLTKEETKALVDFMAATRDQHCDGRFHKKDTRGIESWLAGRGSKEAVAAYYTLKIAAMGTARPADLSKAVEALRKETPEWYGEEAYIQHRKDNAVVIQGDTFSEKIASMRHDGKYTPEEIQAFGREAVQEVERMIAQLQAERDEADTKKSEMFEKIGAAWRRRDADTADRLQPEYDRLYQVYVEAERKLMRGFVPLLLSRVRKVGGVDQSKLDAHLPGNSEATGYVSRAYGQYPTEWIEMSMNQGRITTEMTGRGYYSHYTKTIAISGLHNSARNETATHELGHRFEYTIPGVMEAEAAFYKRRTSGEPLQSLRLVTGNQGYKPNEMTRVDSFLNPYMGKDYGGQGFELVSMGFEMAFHEPRELLKDRDYAEFIFGLLIAG